MCSTSGQAWVAWSRKPAATRFADDLVARWAQLLLLAFGSLLPDIRTIVAVLRRHHCQLELDAARTALPYLG
jgi:hypothetical protein